MGVQSIQINVSGAGLFECTGEINRIVANSGISEGLCTVFIRHTSASLLIQENADPSVQRDLNNWFKRLVPENDSLYTHTNEGPDDMPGHIKAALTATSLSIPVVNGALGLGTWQGVFVWEHRRHRGQRSLLVHLSE